MIGTNLSIKDDLDELDEIHDDSIFGKGLLTFPSHISSVRHGMFSAQTEQLVNVKSPDFPIIFTNYENVIGENSSGYLRANSNYFIMAKIEKFPGSPDTPYVLVLRDTVTGKYHVEHRQVGRRLTEHYGYRFNNDTIDALIEGDTIKKDTVLYQSTSYDEAMNYRYGINVDCVYMIEAHTIEDAYIVSESTAERLTAFEYDDVSISLNDNDVLINYHGDDKFYKSFPNIGETIDDGIIAVKRRIDYSRILYDFKKENLRVILDGGTDAPYYVKGVVKDIDIYSNKPIEELMGSECNSQIIHYLRIQNDYYNTVVSVLGEIIDSGATCSDDLTYLYRRALDIMNPEVKWRTGKNKIYNNIIINFFVEHEVPATEGLKLCGRFGDKGVIAKIVPDNEMPINTETGKPIGMICNKLGVYNRMNPGQIYCVELTFIGGRISEKMATLENLKDKRELLFKYFAIVNLNYHNKMVEIYEKLSLEDKVLFIQEHERGPIHVHLPPFWDNIKLKVFEILYTEFDWIELYKCSIYKHGRVIPILKPLMIGTKYIIRLKHTAKGKFSARSTGHINIKSVPAKSLSAKQYRSLYSKTPVRCGEMEFNNIALIGTMVPLARTYMIHSASTQGRRKTSALYVKDPTSIEYFELGEIRNRNVDSLMSLIKAAGIKYSFNKEIIPATLTTAGPTVELAKRPLCFDPFTVMHKDKKWFDPFETVEPFDPFKVIE